MTKPIKNFSGGTTKAKIMPCEGAELIQHESSGEHGEIATRRKRVVKEMSYLVRRSTFQGSIQMRILPGENHKQT